MASGPPSVLDEASPRNPGSPRGVPEERGVSGKGYILGEGQGSGWEQRQGGVGLFVLSREQSDSWCRQGSRLSRRSGDWGPWGLRAK